jgi:hypothetical protein
MCPEDLRAGAGALGAANGVPRPRAELRVLTGIHGAWAAGCARTRANVALRARGRLDPNSPSNQVGAVVALKCGVRPAPASSRFGAGTVPTSPRAVEFAPGLCQEPMGRVSRQPCAGFPRIARSRIESKPEARWCESGGRSKAGVPDINERDARRAADGSPGRCATAGGSRPIAGAQRRRTRLTDGMRMDRSGLDAAPHVRRVTHGAE